MKYDSLMDIVDYRHPPFYRGWKGALWDSQEKLWYDLFGDSGAASLGANCEELVGLYSELKETATHIPAVHGLVERERVSSALCLALGQERAFWCASGAESVEAAIKIARRHAWNQERGPGNIYSYAGDFHGRTYGAMAASFGPVYHREGYGPMTPGFVSFDKLEEINWQKACGVIICPMTCDHDFREHQPDFLKRLWHMCSDAGVPLIFDEVQTGSGRTGEMAYGHHLDIVPDIVCLAKGIGMGIPVGITLANGPYANVFTPGTHFSTFGGNAIQIKAVKRYLDWYYDVGSDKIDEDSIFWRAELERIFGAVRGRGLCLAVDVESGERLLKASQRERIVLGIFRKGAGALRITPALNMERADAEQALERLERAVKSC